MKSKYEEENMKPISTAALAGRVVDLFPGSRDKPRLSNATLFRHEDGILWGMAFDGGAPCQRQGIENIQKAFGIPGQAALGEGLDSPVQTGIEIRAVHELPSSRFRNSYDVHTGIHIVSYGMDMPEGLVPKKGALQALWSKQGFLLISQDEEDDCLRILERAFRREKEVAIFLSDKHALGFFLSSKAPPEFLKSLDKRDHAEVKARHESLVFESDWKGRVVTDSKGSKKPVSSEITDTKQVA